MARKTRAAAGPLIGQLDGVGKAARTGFYYGALGGAACAISLLGILAAFSWGADGGTPGLEVYAAIAGIIGGTIGAFTGLLVGLLLRLIRREHQARLAAAIVSAAPPIVVLANTLLNTEHDQDLIIAAATATFLFAAIGRFVGARFETRVLEGSRPLRRN